MSLQEQIMKPAQSEEAPVQVSLKDQMEGTASVSDPREGLRLAETFVKKFYLDDLDHYSVTKAPRSVIELSTDRNLKMFRVSGLVFDKDENVQDRLNNVYSSMHGLNLSVIFMLISNGRDIDFYIGIKTTSDDFSNNSELGKAFEKAFRGNFPGSEIKPVNINECASVLEKIIPEDGMNAVTSLTSLPSLKDEDATNTQYVQGIEKFIDTMQGENYAVMIISDPVSGGQIEQMKQGYEELYSELAPLAEYNLTISANQGTTLSESEMEGYTDTIGRSVSKTQSFTKGTSVTKGKSTTNTFGVGAGVMGSAGLMSSNSTNISKNFLKTLGSSLFGGPVAVAAVNGLTQALGANLGINVSKSVQLGETDGTNESVQTGDQQSEEISQAKTKQHSTQQGVTTGSSTASTVKYENKSIKVFLECVEEHLKRLKECENYGMWSSAAYFISPSKETSIISASAYKGIINGEGTSLEASSLNTWFNDEKTKEINNYLRHFTHPRFHDPDFLIDYKATADVTASTMVSTKEMSIQCSVPYKSVPGVFVREMANFGRDVFDTSNDTDIHRSTLRLGCIHHMGEDFGKHTVSIDLEKLREHTFITGSTGSGKSNTVYEMVAGLDSQKIATLIIEPAKGEYKQVFGEKFNVYGTNPDATEILRINPFKFENGVHVLEHIDRLIDIFNVCWPMYAAMPAVLKEAVESAYVQCGWDLNTSKNKLGIDLYPCFADILNSLRTVINSSDYSQEVKDNYTGSLITRVKSLTNGLNGQIFTSDEVDNAKLFEESTIIDLSRIGASETKAMIMGIVVMRLQERRMVQSGINLPLKHVTVLEEAHNLLKKTSSEQSMEGANLLGKSVEMISNAIAEMRTYGEGFIIVDQAPGLLDMSVIRNTNTKIIMHLPDMTDRELVGKSAGLTDDQLIELAKLPSGIAAVYQNRWIEPVLCHIDFYDVKPKVYQIDASTKKSILSDDIVKKDVLNYLISLKYDSSKLKDVEGLQTWLQKSNLSAAIKINLLNLSKKPERISKKRIERLVCDLVDSGDMVFKKARNSESIDEWNESIIANLDFSLEGMSKNGVESILECLIHYRGLEETADDANFLKWMNYMGRKVI
jgi:hypothetical protein